MPAGFSDVRSEVEVGQRGMVGGEKKAKDFCGSIFNSVAPISCFPFLAFVIHKIFPVAVARSDVFA